MSNAPNLRKAIEIAKAILYSVKTVVVLIFQID